MTRTTAQPDTPERKRQRARTGAAQHVALVADRSPSESVEETAGAAATGEAAPWAYGRDLAERWLLYLDTLRERAEVITEHARQGLPPLLDFKYETILDARRFEQPANYALLRITEIGDLCWADCVDEASAPVIVVDPRAGHGPGIGGFKHDSEVGIAMHEGHPVYFVMFFPEPMPDQMLEDVHHALRRFVAEIARRHPDTPPVLYGNCQAGWAVTLLAADCVGLAGPVVLNGAPLSYWAGAPDSNPMRVMGGLSGGVWAAKMIADLGDGRFDGAWLAQNFERLQPEKALWEKHAHLFSHVDSERDRFLEFERWWNGFYTLGREEIVAISRNLFIGNRLETGEMRICDGCSADLRRIRSPIVVFASEGDNITPPAQALGWVAQVYRDSDDLKAADQRIVYLINPHVGHLGIFVSASVARFEHRAILESLGRIEALPPGLYEMKIDNPTGDPDCASSQYSVRFEPREVADLGAAPPTDALQQVARVSAMNEAAYDMFVGPWMRAITTPASAEALRMMHPMRWTRQIFSERYNPWMGAVRLMAEAVSKTRAPLPDDHPAIRAERAALAAMGERIGAARRTRDAATARVFNAVYPTPDTKPKE